MTLKSRFVLLGLISIFFGGCTNLAVYGPGSTVTTKTKWPNGSEETTTSTKAELLKGIPFYIKVPVLTQTTKRLKEELLVTIDLSIVEKSVPIEARSYPVGGPLHLCDDPTKRRLVDALMAKLVKDVSENGSSLDKAEGKILAVLKFLEQIKPVMCDNRVVSNSWGFSMVVGPQPYYISGKIPLIGSATSNFEFSGDGTLTKAESTVTDDTVKTLLSLFPIADKLKSRWGISSDDLDKSTAKGIPLDSAAQAHLETTVASSKTLYTLAKSKVITDPTIANAYMKEKDRTPLDLEDGMKGLKGVQLISEEQINSKEGKGGEAPDADAYHLEGTITPPAKPNPPNPANVNPNQVPAKKGK